MPRIAQELGPLAVRRLGPGVHAVGGAPGLCLQVAGSGARSWILRVRHDGRRRNFGLGPFPAVSLAEAREAARAMLADLRAGRDPSVERKRRKGLTLAQAVPAFLAARGADLGGEGSRRDFARSLELHILPRLGGRQVAGITLQDIHGALAPLWRDRPDTGQRVRQRLERLFHWTIAAGHRAGQNPALWKGGLAELLPSPGRVHRKRPMPRLATADLPAWWAALGTGPHADCLRLIALTACRSGEARGADASEFDLEAAVWTIPAERMKRRKAHRVPLCGPAVALVRRLPGQGLIFPGMDPWSLKRAMWRAAGALRDPDSGERPVPHGLRASFSSWAAESGVAFELAEAALAHQIGTAVSRAYQRDDLLERRRPVMEAWAGFLTGRSEALRVVGASRAH
jgi:integrase